MSKLLKRAKVKLHNAQNNYHQIAIDDAYLDDCCYNLQQSIEMTLKYIVEMYGESYTANHDIRAQLNKLKKLCTDLPHSAELSMMAVTLNSWEAESRYKDSFFSTIDEINMAMQYAEDLISFAENLVKETKNPIDKIDTF